MFTEQHCYSNNMTEIKSINMMLTQTIVFDWQQQFTVHKLPSSHFIFYFCSV